MVDLVHRRHRPGHRQWRRLQQDRHLSEGARRARQRRAVLCGAAVADHRFQRRRRDQRNSDRAARRRRGHAHDRARPPTGGSRRCGSCPEGSPVANYGFDVTPARLVTGLITERGVLQGRPRRARRRVSRADRGRGRITRKKADAERLDRSRRRCGGGPLRKARPRSGACGSIPRGCWAGSAAGAAWRRQHLGEDAASPISTATDVEVLCVKGSGWDMGTIEPAGLPAVRLAPLLKLRARETPVRRGHGAAAARQPDRSGVAQSRRSRRCCTPSSRTNSSTTPIPPRCLR